MTLWSCWMWLCYTRGWRCCVWPSLCVCRVVREIRCWGVVCETVVRGGNWHWCGWDCRTERRCESCNKKKSGCLSSLFHLIDVSITLRPSLNWPIKLYWEKPRANWQSTDAENNHYTKPKIPAQSSGTWTVHFVYFRHGFGKNRRATSSWQKCILAFDGPSCGLLQMSENFLKVSGHIYKYVTSHPKRETLQVRVWRASLAWCRSEVMKLKVQYSPPSLCRAECKTLLTSHCPF